MIATERNWLEIIRNQLLVHLISIYFLDCINSDRILEPDRRVVRNLEANQKDLRPRSGPRGNLFYRHWLTPRSDQATPTSPGRRRGRERKGLFPLSWESQIQPPKLHKELCRAIQIDTEFWLVVGQILVFDWLDGSYPVMVVIIRMDFKEFHLQSRGCGFVEFDFILH